MVPNNKSSALIVGLLIFLGLSSLGYLLGSSALKIKEYERTVTVKGLSEREFDADIVIWPIQFTAAENNLEALYVLIDSSTSKIIDFLSARGIGKEEISFGAPAITDKSAQQYGDGSRGEGYQAQTEYIFTRINDVKPEMIEESTRKAREVAEKFASDSKSSLGKIRRASQGQFSIEPRDRNNPHIKKVRVVSTVEYYLSD